MEWIYDTLRISCVVNLDIVIRSRIVRYVEPYWPSASNTNTPVSHYGVNLHFELLILEYRADQYDVKHSGYRWHVRQGVQLVTRVSGGEPSRGVVLFQNLARRFSSPDTRVICQTKIGAIIMSAIMIKAVPEIIESSRISRIPINRFPL